MRLFLCFALFLSCSTAQASCVILLHGLARSSSSMEELAIRLTESGHQTVNLGYQSTEHRVEVLAEMAITPALEECANTSEVNFVTHSLGGILVREFLSKHEIPNLARVVMLGPPNQGSEVVDTLHDVPGFHLMNGDAGLQLGTGAMSVPNTLGPADFDVGIIAGNESINLILSTFIPGVDDGKVSIESTKLAGMNDHIEMPTSHPFMMKNEEVISQVIYYLDNGRFQRPAESGIPD